MKERRKKPLDFCSIHDALLRQALKAPRGYRARYEFHITFQARRVKAGVLVTNLTIDHNA